MGDSWGLYDAVGELQDRAGQTEKKLDYVIACLVQAGIIRQDTAQVDQAAAGQQDNNLMQCQEAG